MVIETSSEYKNTRSNERYDLFVDVGETLTVATTFLKPKQETLGHSHPNVENYYFHNDCILKIGDDRYTIKAPLKVHIPSNVFHQVINPYNNVVVFTCTYETIT